MKTATFTASISKCADCPHCNFKAHSAERGYFCAHEKAKPEMNAVYWYQIPEWCPLPDADA